MRFFICAIATLIAAMQVHAETTKENCPEIDVSGYMMSCGGSPMMEQVVKTDDACHDLSDSSGAIKGSCVVRIKDGHLEGEVWMGGGCQASPMLSTTTIALGANECTHGSGSMMASMAAMRAVCVQPAKAPEPSPTPSPTRTPTPSNSPTPSASASLAPAASSLLAPSAPGSASLAAVTSASSAQSTTSASSSSVTPVAASTSSSASSAGSTSSVVAHSVVAQASTSTSAVIVTSTSAVVANIVAPVVTQAVAGSTQQVAVVTNQQATSYEMTCAERFPGQTESTMKCCRWGDNTCPGLAKCDLDDCEAADTSPPGDSIANQVQHSTQYETVCGERFTGNDIRAERPCCRWGDGACRNLKKCTRTLCRGGNQREHHKHTSTQSTQKIDDTMTCAEKHSLGEGSFGECEIDEHKECCRYSGRCGNLRKCQRKTCCL